MGRSLRYEVCDVEIPHPLSGVEQCLNLDEAGLGRVRMEVEKVRYEAISSAICVHDSHESGFQKVVYQRTLGVVLKMRGSGGTFLKSQYLLLVLIAFCIFFFRYESFASVITEELKINDSNIMEYEWLLLSSNHMPVAIFGIAGGSAGTLIGSYYTGYFFLEGLSIVTRPTFEPLISRENLGLAGPVVLPLIWLSDIVIIAEGVLGSVVSSLPAFSGSVLSGYAALYSFNLLHISMEGLFLSKNEKALLEKKISEFRDRKKTPKDNPKISEYKYQSFTYDLFPAHLKRNFF
jgi:hypothetical protein